ncbi:nuclear transport factor 2 family protein [Pontibacter silvestris]|uniref:Nuclear transport factor 2 family protein n=1 Tax=Pontibacter silvestris TaxID=2305183 RepID=A0ABW4X1M0_9BACT|nr:nuclear transport factor 2 family protein [Pontibacter silvestris]MCC9138651.1 nuclear transport factor 2 family protein [Pontibacter silvestris]
MAKEITEMKTQTFINDWIATGNDFKTKEYLDFYQPDAILDDPSVGATFSGHSGIREYFDSYFIGFQTQTKLVRLDVLDDENAHLEVEFTGKFPEGKIGGTFDFTFKGGKISFVKADLIL